MKLDMADLKVETIPPKHPGGQHTPSQIVTIRVTHIPSGFMVQCKNDRSQNLNLKAARAGLIAMFHVFGNNKWIKK